MVPGVANKPMILVLLSTAAGLMAGTTPIMGWVKRSRIVGSATVRAAQYEVYPVYKLFFSFDTVWKSSVIGDVDQFTPGVTLGYGFQDTEAADAGIKDQNSRQAFLVFNQNFNSDGADGDFRCSLE